MHPGHGYGVVNAGDCQIVLLRVGKFGSVAEQQRLYEASGVGIERRAQRLGQLAGKARRNKAQRGFAGRDMERSTAVCREQFAAREDIGVAARKLSLRARELGTASQRVARKRRAVGFGVVQNGCART